jgi:hypothetical protein
VSFGTWGFKSPFAHKERFYEPDAQRSRTLGFVTFVVGGGGFRLAVPESDADNIVEILNAVRDNAAPEDGRPE